MSDGIEWRGFTNNNADPEAEREQRFTHMLNGGVESPAFVREDGKLEAEQVDRFTLLRTDLERGRSTFKTWSFASFDRAADYAATHMTRDAELRDRWIQVDPAHWRNDITSEEWRVIANSPK